MRDVDYFSNKICSASRQTPNLFFFFTCQDIIHSAHLVNPISSSSSTYHTDILSCHLVNPICTSFKDKTIQMESLKRRQPSHVFCPASDAPSGRQRLDINSDPQSSGKSSFLRYDEHADTEEDTPALTPASSESAASPGQAEKGVRNDGKAKGQARRNNIGGLEHFLETTYGQISRGSAERKMERRHNGRQSGL